MDLASAGYAGLLRGKSNLANDSDLVAVPLAASNANFGLDLQLRHDTPLLLS
jgi:hypothetical protein